jgi:hypothetical protein
MTTREFVEVQIDGKTYSGTYEVVSGGVVTVSTQYGRKSTQVGSSPPGVVARSSYASWFGRRRRGRTR